ncbi:MAG TPA: acetyl-CoA hydrolase/transferase C-terminal domain-containing protein [Xanthomonadaceae bacterium]|nr:acetyl-CoA hydrolase/transferase C-terminal domain-containing protein [Xanthomonadaceae bacterium]
MRESTTLTRIDDAAREVFARTSGPLVLAAPLGLGKPNRLLNAIYRIAEQDGSRPLTLLTALSLTPPSPAPGLERRFLAPFLDRHLGSGYPVLDYAIAQRNDALPPNITVEEFYLQSGALLGSSSAQRHYTSLNYTHVAQAVAGRGINVIVHLVAAGADGRHLSLSCNPDVTLDLLDEIARRGLDRPMLIAEVHPQLPYMGGTAEVPREFFDLVVEPDGPAPALFGLVREPVADADHAIGLYASTLVRDGGSLQIGIGALSDALTHALVLRHTRNDEYRRIVAALWPDAASSPLVRACGGLGPFQHGLFGASEMIMDGFMHLVEAGVVRRLVVEDVDLMRRLRGGHAGEADLRRLQQEGQFLHGAFFLGSRDFYRWLRELPEEGRRRIAMTRVSHINELYGGQETLERLQRVDARFFNTCMLVTALGAAASDTLEDGRVVSGVGGQYNFVAMAHALSDARSALLFRATHGHGAAATSNVRWSYPNLTIPRHLRDLAITQYGIADLRGRSDEDCVIATTAIAEARFQPGLLDKARAARKLAPGFGPPARWADNTASRLAETLAPFRTDGLLPDYPLGSDFTDIEQRLVRALGWLRRNTASGPGKVRAIAAGLLASGSRDAEAMERMQLAAPRGLRERLQARLLHLALRRA